MDCVSLNVSNWLEMLQSGRVVESTLYLVTTILIQEASLIMQPLYLLELSWSCAAMHPITI